MANLGTSRHAYPAAVTTPSPNRSVVSMSNFQIGRVLLLDPGRLNDQSLAELCPEAAA